MKHYQINLFFYICGIAFLVMGLGMADSGLISSGIFVLLITHVVSKFYDKHILNKIGVV